VVKVKAHKYGDLNYTLNADHPEYFTLHKGSYYSTDIEELVEGENKLTIPESAYNSYITIVPNDNCYITSILVDSVEKFVEDSKYTSVTITEGTAIEVKSDKYIDASYKLTFKYENDGEGFISDVKVNGVSVADPHNPDGIYIKAGATVDIYGNSDDYKFNSMSIGDKAYTYFNQPTEFVMKGETEVTVDATKYATFSITVNVDNPDNFTLYKGYSADATKIIPLKAGANKLDLSTNLSAITFIKNSGCYFTSVKVSGTEQYYQGNSSVYVYRSSLSEGTVIDVESGAIVRDKNLVIYVNDKSLATHGMGFTLSDRSSLEIENGYNSFNFAESDLPIEFGANGQTSESVYLNDEAVAPNYSGSTARTFNALPDNSVIKVFFNEVPETHAVSVTVPAGVTYTIVKDLITKVDLGTTATKGTAAADTPSFNVLGKTHIDITVKADADHTVGVKVNNEAVEAVDGVYSFDVDATTAIEITSTSGISDLTIEGNATFDVYNLQGIRVAHGVSDFNNLPAGIYIANGKKVVVR
jgi:hypothetical protein